MRRRLPGPRHGQLPTAHWTDQHSFDAVTLPFVISVTPERGNHFAGVRGLRWLESAFAPFADRIGFRSDLTLARAMQLSGMQSQEVRPLGPLGFCTLLHLRRPP